MIICCFTKNFELFSKVFHCFQLSNVKKVITLYYNKSTMGIVFAFSITILWRSLFQAIRHCVTSSTQISTFVKTDRISIDRKRNNHKNALYSEQTKKLAIIFFFSYFFLSHCWRTKAAKKIINWDTRKKNNLILWSFVDMLGIVPVNDFY